MSRIDAVVRLIKREPVAFQAFVQAMLAALVGFGVVHWSPEQLGLVMGAVAALLALFTRATVSPTAKAKSAAGGARGRGHTATGRAAAGAPTSSPNA